jgi:outer membrane protein assembly factor BamB
MKRSRSKDAPLAQKRRHGSFATLAMCTLAVVGLCAACANNDAPIVSTATPESAAAPTASRDIVPSASPAASPTAPAAGVTTGPALTAQNALPYDWLQFNFDSQHSGNNTKEMTIAAGNVGSLHRLFQISLPAIADGAPAYLSGVRTPTGIRDLLFVTTKAGHIIALDAHMGAQVWAHQYAAGSCRINLGFQPCYTTSSPAIDPNRQYVYSYGLDGYVHKYRVGDGVETTSGGWPELASLKPFNEKGSSALSIVTTRNGASYLYVTNGGYLGDRGDYQGHVTVISLADGAQHVFNADCSDQPVHFVEQPGTPDCPAVQSAIWARAGIVYDPDTDRIYMATGNGRFDPALHDWGDTVFALRADGTGANGDPLDSYTPSDFQALDDRDLDLGSTAPAILPAPANSAVKHLAMQGGKDGILRLLNLDNLSGQRGLGHTGGEVGPVINVPQGGPIFTAPAVLVNPADGATWVFVANARGLSGLRLMVEANGMPSLQLIWETAQGGTSPIVANGVLYYAGSNDLCALDPITGNLLWHDAQIGGIHWESPIVANGVLYITDESSHLTAFVPLARSALNLP